MVSALLVAAVGCGSPRARAEEDCSALIAQANQLVGEAAACTEGEACVLVSNYALAGESNCLEAFQCDGAYGAGADLAALERQARQIVARYKGSCSVCYGARCGRFERAECMDSRCQAVQSAPP
jgi:hypothetical protein